jgi:hypothetical protein
MFQTGSNTGIAVPADVVEAVGRPPGRARRITRGRDVVAKLED